MGQVAVGIWEVWLEFQCRAVGRDGLWNVARILEKGWIAMVITQY